MKEVPNLTFSKTNFTGYTIQIRGIGTQAISVTTDPAVAVALNDIPFIRNHFFEQEFFDVNQVEVLRGPQGTLYGRNATAGVVNVISAKPTDQFEAMALRRYRQLSQPPLRRHGQYSRSSMTASICASPANGPSATAIRPTSSPAIPSTAAICGRAASRWAGSRSENVQAYLVWEHFQENDDRMRTSKQLCKTDPTTTEVGGVPVPDQRHSGLCGPALSEPGLHADVALFARMRSKCRTA